MEKMKEIFKPVLYSSGRKCRTCPMPNIDVNNKKKEIMYVYHWAF